MSNYHDKRRHNSILYVVEIILIIINFELNGILVL